MSNAVCVPSNMKVAPLFPLETMADCYAALDGLPATTIPSGSTWYVPVRYTLPIKPFSPYPTCRAYRTRSCPMPSFRSTKGVSFATRLAPTAPFNSISTSTIWMSTLPTAPSCFIWMSSGAVCAQPLTANPCPGRSHSKAYYRTHPSTFLPI